MSATDPEKNWENKWKAILEKEDGTINVAQLKLELADFEDLIDRMIELTGYITGGRMSYATYPVKTIIAVHEEVKEEALQDQIEEDLKDGICSMCDSEIYPDDVFDEDTFQ